MSISYSVFVGPYVKCVNHLVENDSTIRTCTNQNCKVYKSQVWDTRCKFCRECGNPIGDITIKKFGTKVNASQLRDEIHEALTNVNQEYPWKELKCDDAEIDIWVANQDRGLGISNGIWFDPKGESKYIDLTNIDTISCIEEFAGAYGKGIRLLREAYGPDNVEIKWGAFNWAQ